MVAFDVLAVPFFAASGVLVASGGSKLRLTSPSERALYAAGFPSGPPVVRALGAIEIAVGVTALLAPVPVAALAVAALYLLFAVFLGTLLARRVPAASCGCAGERDLPPSWLHVAMNLVVVAVAIGVAATAGSEPTGVMRFAADTPLAGVPFVFGVLLIAWLSMLVVAYVPSLFASYQGRINA